MPQLALTLDADGPRRRARRGSLLRIRRRWPSRYTDAARRPHPRARAGRVPPVAALACCRRCFRSTTSPQELVAGLAHVLRIEPSRFTLETLADRVWEREWLRDFHAMCFGARLWVAPHHAHVAHRRRGRRAPRSGARVRHRHARRRRRCAWPGSTNTSRDGRRRHRLRLRLGRARGRRGQARARARRTPTTSIRRRCIATRDNAAANGVEAAVRVVDDARRSCPAARTCCWPTSSAARCASSRRDLPRCSGRAARIVLAGMLDRAGRRSDRAAHAPLV